MTASTAWGGVTRMHEAMLRLPAFVAMAAFLGCVLGLTPGPALGFGPGFVENAGQFPAPVRYAAGVAGGMVYITDVGLLFDMGEAEVAASGEAGMGSRRVALGVSFSGPGAVLAVTPGRERPERYRWIRGRGGPRRTHPAAIEARVFETLAFRVAGSRAAFTLELSGGALCCRIESESPAGPWWNSASLEFGGADAVVPDGRGGTRLVTPIGSLRCELDLAARGDTLLVFRWSGGRDEGAWGAGPAGAPGDATGYDFVLGTFLGGSGSEQGGNQVALLANGNLAVAGYTRSPDFPATLGSYDDGYEGLGDAFIAIMDSGAVNLVWCTFIGGSSWDQATALAIGPAGEILLSGFTESADFPVSVSAADTTLGGARDAFLCAVDATGSALLWSRYLGGGDTDEARGMALAGALAFVTGYTGSTDFPVTSGAFLMSRQGGADAFVARIEASSGTIGAATYLGGPADDRGLDIAVAVGGSPVICGETLSPGFPTTVGAYDRSYNGGTDGFVCQLDSALTAEVWGSFIGGTGWDQAAALSLDPGGRAIVTGFTWSGSWPTTPGAFDRILGGGRDGFVARFATDGSTLEWSTFLGGNQNDACWAVAADALGNVVVTGETRSPDFPLTASAFDPSFGGQWDAFATRIRSTGDSLLWSSFLGGQYVDVGTSVALDLAGDPLVAGWTTSIAFPWHAGCFDSTQNGDADAFLVKFGLTRFTDVGGAAAAMGLSPRAMFAEPNPFRDACEVRLESGAGGGTEIELVDLAGRAVRRAVTAAGEPAWRWDGRDDHGREVPPGLYLARARSGGQTRNVKIVRLR